MGFDYTKIKFFKRQKLVSKYTVRAHFPWSVLWRYFALRHLLILMCQPNAHWRSNNGFFLSQWLACLNNKHNVYKQEISLYFFTASKHISAVILDYACTSPIIWKWSLPSLWSYLPWWLWPRPTKQVWITYTVVNQPRFHGSKIY